MNEQTFGPGEYADFQSFCAGKEIGAALNGHSIVDPWTDESMIRHVDPRDYYGFGEIDTGGGCKALSVEDEDGNEIILTDSEEPVPPECRHDWSMGAVDRFGNQVWTIIRDPSGTITVRWRDNLDTGPTVVPKPGSPEAVTCYRLLMVAEDSLRTVARLMGGDERPGDVASTFREDIEGLHRRVHEVRERWNEGR